jgi:hypothetical protein
MSKERIIGGSILKITDRWSCFSNRGSTCFGPDGEFGSTRDIDAAFASLHQFIDEVKERAKLITGPETFEIKFKSTILANYIQVSDMEHFPFDE